MLADDRITLISLSEVPMVRLYERGHGISMTVLYVPVRTEYGETEEEAVVRAKRIASWLTDDVAVKKSRKVERSTP
jgi:hypothetical protein